MNKVLLTRAAADSEAFASTLSGWRTVHWPLLTIRFLDIVKPNQAEWIFTSRNGVEAAKRLGLTGTAHCVGPATAEAARQAGFDPVTQASGDAEGLIESLKDCLTPLTHIRGRESRGDVAVRLDASEVIAYAADATTTVPPEVDAAIRSDLTHVAVFSPRTAEIFAQLALDAWRMEYQRLSLVAISEAAAAPLRAFAWAEVIVAAESNADAMRAALCGAAK
ncbi:MAG: uroporphyrinogen-III synthase [Pseudomonadota bacterium]